MLAVVVEDEDRPRKSSHVKPRDALIVLGVLAVLTVLLKPVYDVWAGNREKTICRENLGAMAKAVEGYSVQHDDRLPPSYAIGADGSPNLVEGLAETWATYVQPFMEERHGFKCPSADSSELSSSYSLTKATRLQSAYGMYRGLSSAPRSQIPDPGTTVLLAETSDQGSKGTFDPVRWKEGQSDGFSIGWDTGEGAYSKQTAFVTRLAFRNAGPGYGGASLTGRHGDVVFAVTAAGAFRALGRLDARVQQSPPRLKGTWWADLNLFR